MEKTENNLNWPILGNEHIVEFLSKSLKDGRVFGTYIFSGPDDLGKTTVAKYFAYSMLCQKNDSSKASVEIKKLPCGECTTCRQNKVGQALTTEDDNFMGVHPDLHIIKREKDKKNISIDQVRSLIHSLSMSSFLNSYKIGIIKNAESLNDESANALLKTLEEPKNKVIIILITSDAEALPATILSRSQLLRFRPVKTDLIYDYLIKTFGTSRVTARNLARLSLGRPALAVKFLENKDFYESYLKRVSVFLNFSTKDINERFLMIEELLGTKITGQETVKLAKRIIEVWQGVARDLILANYGQHDLIQHEMMDQELIREKAKLTIPVLLSLSEKLSQADKYLKANVNPKLVLEGVAISF
ncbi:MAG: polymerase III, delta prime subunit protein [Parcubacteria group bacterium GW2011_GWE2_39_37]|uniref:Polymerase III, delta prime subunit protein n=1 Tax=Candidatus Falkowbacteria bacterium GW2011_GWF2_39_8 TaxID=1618642 RepID=A0A0G0PUP9_9BACT|nr:MAG: polymerase III, delta prime subunit protein [Parcubacteria group bacterium GW2011_GWE2_39_37]KKR31899.1 MAG: polymerase III, delta prime subunit protein [Candidatus Falkowbacteria bacterium GW2011_GWF2_39_8]